MIYISQGEANKWQVELEEWVEIETKMGATKMKVDIRDEMPDGLVRVPHGWWKPEMEQGLGKLSGAWDHADAQVCPDDEGYRDLEQGLPHLKGIACRINKLAS